jgi:hypothetical protein
MHACVHACALLFFVFFAFAQNPQGAPAFVLDVAYNNVAELPDGVRTALAAVCMRV